jgi:hypothetical protein
METIYVSNEYLAGVLNILDPFAVARDEESEAILAGFEPDFEQERR